MLKGCTSRGLMMCSNWITNHDMSASIFSLNFLKTSHREGSGRRLRMPPRISSNKLLRPARN